MAGKNPTQQLVDDYAFKTEKALKTSIDQNKVGKYKGKKAHLEELKRNLTVSTEHQQGLSKLIVSFPLGGRFSDMGVGRGVKISNRDVSRSILTGKPLNRKAKKWYARVFFGRMNRLRGAVGANIVEQAVAAIRKGMHGTTR